MTALLIDSNTCLLIVDAQYGFMPGGGLPVMAISCAGPAFSLSQEFLLNEVRPRLIEMARKLQASAGRT